LQLQNGADVICPLKEVLSFEKAKIALPIPLSATLDNIGSLAMSCCQRFIHRRSGYCVGSYPRFLLAVVAGLACNSWDE